MIYRSAQIDSIPSGSRQELKNIGIRTIIDLRSENECHNYPQLHDDGFKIVHIPILTGNMEKILQGIREDKIKTDTIYRLVERMKPAVLLPMKYPKNSKSCLPFFSTATIIRPSFIVHRGKGVQEWFPHYCSPR